MNLLSSLLKYTADQIAALRAKDSSQDTTVSGINTRLSTAESDIDSLQAQFDTAVAALTVDSEVQNIRNGDDGKTYTSAGEAVRTQFANVKADANAFIKASTIGLGSSAAISYTVVYASISATGLMQAMLPESAKVARIDLEYGAEYTFAIANRDTGCRSGFSNTLFDGTNLQLNDYQVISNGATVKNTKGYKYLYVYYLGSSYPSATISVTGQTLNITDTSLSQRNKAADAYTVGKVTAGLITEKPITFSEDWYIGMAINASGQQVSAPSYALSRMHKLSGKGVKNTGAWKNSDDVALIYYVDEYTIDKVFIQRTRIETPDEYTLSANCGYIRIHFGYSATAGITFTEDDLDYFSFNEVIHAVDKTEQQSNDPLYGKKVVAIGDSLLYGYGIERDEPWLALLADEHNLDAYNYGVSGNPIAISPEDPNGMCVRIDSILQTHTSFDYFILEGGANDMWQGVPFGEIKYLNPDYHYTEGTKYGESTVPPSTFKYLPNLDKETFCGAINYIIKEVRDTCPTARILLMTNYNRKRGRTNALGLLDEDYVNKMIEVAEFNGVPYIDNYHGIGFNIVDASTRAVFDTGDQHINASGHQWLKNIYYQKLLSLGY